MAQIIHRKGIAGFLDRIRFAFFGPKQAQSSSYRPMSISGTNRRRVGKILTYATSIALAVGVATLIARFPIIDTCKKFGAADNFDTRWVDIPLVLLDLGVVFYLVWKYLLKVNQVFEVKKGNRGLLTERGRLARKEGKLVTLEMGEHALAPFQKGFQIPFDYDEMVSLDVKDISVNIKKYGTQDDKNRSNSVPVRASLSVKYRTYDLESRFNFESNPDTADLKEQIKDDIADKTRSGLSRKTYDEIDTNTEHGADEVIVAILTEVAREAGGFYRNGMFFRFDDSKNKFISPTGIELKDPKNGDKVVLSCTENAVILTEILVKEVLSGDKEFLSARNAEFISTQKAEANLKATTIKSKGEAELVKEIIIGLEKANIFKKEGSEKSYEGKRTFAALLLDLYQNEHLYDIKGIDVPAVIKEAEARMNKKGGKK